MPICPPWITSGRWRRSLPVDHRSVFHILCGLSVDSPVEIPLRTCPECPFVRLPFYWAPGIRSKRSGTPGLPLRLRRLGGRGSVRGSPCDEPARLRTGLQGSIPSDPGIRVRLRRLGGQGFVRGSPCGEPARLRFTSLRPPSCGGSAVPLLVHGLCGNGTLEAGLTVPPVLPTAGVPQGANFVWEWGAPPSSGDSAGPFFLEGGKL